MKSIILFLFFALSVLNTFADGPTKISVSVFKSTFIYFDDQVVSIDLGMNESYDATFKKNFVRITAIKQLADYQTNLTVTTRSGLYAFLVDYSDIPEKLYYFPEDFQALRRFTKENKTDEDAAKTDEKKPQTIVNPGFAGDTNQDLSFFKTASQQLAERKMEYPIAAFSRANIEFSVDKIYVSKDKFFVKIIAQNKSNIDFDIDFIKFSVKNKRKIRRASQQEIYMDPLFVFNKFDKLKGNSSDQMIFVIDKFTILKNKQFQIEIEERSGERNLSIEVPTTEILNATELF